MHSEYYSVYFENFINNNRQILTLCCNTAWIYLDASFSTFSVTSLEWMSYLKQASPQWQKVENFYHGKHRLTTPQNLSYSVRDLMEGRDTKF